MGTNCEVSHYNYNFSCFHATLGSNNLLRIHILKRNLPLLFRASEWKMFCALGKCCEALRKSCLGSYEVSQTAVQLVPVKYVRQRNIRKM
jgi:hypothetical protein